MNPKIPYCVNQLIRSSRIEAGMDAGAGVDYCGVGASSKIGIDRQNQVEAITTAFQIKE